MKIDMPALKGWRHAFNVRNIRVGVEKSTIIHRTTKAQYLTRWILYFGFGTLRLHKFWRGDDDRASHTHPWWFITFPLGTYVEGVYERGVWTHDRYVPRFRFSFRPAAFEHVVRHGVRRPFKGALLRRHARPFYTICVTGGRNDSEAGWGFYKPDSTFIPWRKYE